MPMTRDAQEMLRDFEAGRLTDQIAFHDALVEARLDYSPESLERIDALLRQMQEKRAPHFAAFVGEATQANFLALLAWYAGTVVARFTLQEITWYRFKEMAGVLPAEDLEGLSPCFQTSMICVFRRNGQITGYFLPLNSIGQILFEGDKTASVAAAAAPHLRLAVDLPVLRPPATGTATTAFASDQPGSLAAAIHHLGLMAGAQVAWACRTALESGSALAPELAQQKSDGTRLINSMLFMSPEEAFPTCRKRLEEGEEGVVGAVFAYDGFINLARFRTDALVVEARWYAPALHATIAVPYRNADRPDGFALFAPRVLESSFAAGYLPVLEAAFFAGIESFKPAGLWSASHVDENDPANLAARAAEQAAAAYPDDGGAGATGTPETPDGPVPDPFADIRLDEIDVAATIAARPHEEADYTQVSVPYWAEEDALAELFADIPALLREGRVVWGQLLQANDALFSIGHDDGLPGDVLYDPSGRMTPTDLGPIARRLFAARREIETLRAADPPQPELLRIVEHLENELTRARALRLPRPDRSDGLLVSTTFFVRRHLPAWTLMLPYFPLLILDRRPGSVIMLPSRWWPQAVLDLWSRVDRDRVRAAWEQRWQELAGVPDDEERSERQRHQEAIADYALRGVRDEAVGPRMVKIFTDGTQQGFYAGDFRPETLPAPREWEWGLDGILDSLAEHVLRDLERARARGRPFDIAAARKAFAMRQTAAFIRLHSLLLAEPRQVSTDGRKFFPDEILWPALGLVAGCEAPALRLAEVLCAAARLPGMFFGDIRSEVRACFLLFSRQLGVAPPAGMVAEPLPQPLATLLAAERWLDPDAAVLAPLVDAACVEHTETAPRGPFQALPIAIVLLFKLRAARGLANPTVSHPLLAAPLGDFPASVDLDVCLDPPLRALRQRLARNGFDEDAIAAAARSGEPPEAPAQFARPARPPVDSARVAELAEPASRDNRPRFSAAIWLVGTLLALFGTVKLVDALPGHTGIQFVLMLFSVALGILAFLLTISVVRNILVR